MCADSFSRWPPPSQPNGSGFNGSPSVGVINLATPLVNGAAVNARFLLGIQQTGSFKMYMNAEVLTDIGGGAAPRPGPAQELTGDSHNGKTRWVVRPTNTSKSAGTATTGGEVARRMRRRGKKGRGKRRARPDNP